MTRHLADVEAQLPLKALEFEILLALHEGERHGYGLAKAIDARTSGTVRPEPANLYRRIDRLMTVGLVEASSRRRAADAAAERRRYFRITAFGSEVLAAEARRLRSQVKAAVAHRILPRLGRAE